MSNEQKKHTPAPWDSYTHESILEGHERLFNVPIKDYSRANMCVTAMEGIEDPEFYIAEQKKALKASLKLNSELLQYKTACEAINKENPMAVAENISEIFEFITEASLAPNKYVADPMLIYKKCNELKNKILK